MKKQKLILEFDEQLFELIKELADKIYDTEPKEMIYKLVGFTVFEALEKFGTSKALRTNDNENWIH